MTLPRPVLIALLGVALCAAAFLATRSASDTNSAVTTVGPAQQTAPTHKATKPVAPKHATKSHTRAVPARKPATHRSHAAAPAPTKPVTPTAPVTPAKPAKPAVSPQAA